jgi:rhodanese-related sulfurtransferase
VAPELKSGFPVRIYSKSRADTVNQFQQFVVAQWQLVLIFVLSGTMLLWPLFQRRLSGVVDITVNQLTRMLNDEKAVVIDVREAKEFVDGKVFGAIHVPLSQLRSRLNELDRFKERPIVIYDARGQRAQSAASTLARGGFKNLHALHGGFKAWRDAGMPLDKN